MTNMGIIQAILDHWKKGYPKLARGWPEKELIKQATAQAYLAEGEMKDLTMRGASRAEAWSELAKYFLIPLWPYRKEAQG